MDKKKKKENSAVKFKILISRVIESKENNALYSANNNSKYFTSRKPLESRESPFLFNKHGR